VLKHWIDWVILSSLIFLAFGAGMFVQDVVLTRWSCVHGAVLSQTLYYEKDIYGNPGNVNIIGEQVLCAKDWYISSIYGPEFPAEYQLRKWTPKEEWMPWNWGWKKKLEGNFEDNL
jgi:hypothetical protein